MDYRPRNTEGEQHVQDGCVYALHSKAYLRLARRALGFATPAVERVGSFRRIVLNRTVTGGCYSTCLPIQDWRKLARRKGFEPLTLRSVV